MGKLTMNLGILRIRDNKVSAEVDCRYPYGITSDILTDKLQKALSPLTVTLQYDDKPTLADKNSPWLKILLDTYREISGDINAEPVISGGVTYGKAIKNCVAFGPGREGDQVLAHQANERIEIERVKQLFRIYTTAMIRLAAS
jgi:succinyl-diaminopimelate desuccinylase